MIPANVIHEKKMQIVYALNVVNYVVTCVSCHLT